MEHLKIKTPAILMNEIEKIKINKKCTYLEASMIYSENNNLEIEQLGEFIKRIPKLKAKVYSEAKLLKLVIDKENTLV